MHACMGSWVACGKVCSHCWQGRHEGRKPMRRAACLPAACRRMAHPNDEYLKLLHTGELAPPSPPDRPPSCLPACLLILWLPACNSLLAPPSLL
jgi:hypothetical protein